MAQARQTQRSGVVSERERGQAQPARGKKELSPREFNYDRADTEFHSGLKELTGRAKDFKTLVHEMGMIALQFAFGKNEYSYLSRLAVTVRDEMNAREFSQLKKWIQTYSPAVWRRVKAGAKDSLEGSKFRKSNAADANKFDLNGANKNPYYVIELTEDNGEAGSEESDNDNRVPMLKLFKKVDGAIQAIRKTIEAHDLLEGEEQEPMMLEFVEELLEVVNKYRPEEAQEEERKAA